MLEKWNEEFGWSKNEADALFWTSAPRTKVSVVYYVYLVVMMLNAIPADSGILDRFPRCGIITGCKIDTKKDFRAVLGTYVEASKDANITNTVANQTHSCLAIRPSRHL